MIKHEMTLMYIYPSIDGGWVIMDFLNQEHKIPMPTLDMCIREMYSTGYKISGVTNNVNYPTANGFFFEKNNI